MTDNDIVKNYRNRANPPKTQIKILRQLTGKTTGQIVKILQSAGEKVDIKKEPSIYDHIKIPRKEFAERTQMILSLRAAGYTTSQIRDKTGLTEMIIHNSNRDARRLGLKIPENLIKKKVQHDTI